MSRPSGLPPRSLSGLLPGLLFIPCLLSIGCQVNFSKGYQRFHDKLSRPASERDRQEWAEEAEEEYSDGPTDGSAAAPLPENENRE